MIQRLCADYSVKVPANLHSTNNSTHPYDSSQALTAHSGNEVSQTGTAVASIEPSKEAPHPKERGSSLPSNSQTALPLAKAQVSTTNLATYTPSVPRRSASLVRVAGESTTSLPNGRNSAAGRHGGRLGGMVGGRVAVGGSDG